MKLNLKKNLLKNTEYTVNKIIKKKYQINLIIKKFLINLSLINYSSSPKGLK
jgi:hypothetical protein